MVRYFSQLAFIWPADADNEFAVYLPGISIDDLSFQQFGEFDGHPGLADTCRAADDDHIVLRHVVILQPRKTGLKLCIKSFWSGRDYFYGYTSVARSCMDRSIFPGKGR